MITEITEKLKNNGSSEATIKQYLSCLKKLNDSKEFKSLSFLKKKDDINKKIDTLKETTKRNYYTAIVSILKLYDNKYKALKDYYYKLMMKPIAEIKKVYSDYSELQNKYYSFEKDILKLIKKRSTSKEPLIIQKLQDYLLSSFYILIEPRRSEYLYLKLSDNSIYPSMDFNYIDIKSKQLIFNNYKTVNTYGQQKINIPDQLFKIIKLYLKHNPKKNNEDIFDFKFKHDINKSLNRVFGDNISSSHLRHSYLKYKFGDVNKEKKEIADKMGHSVNMQDSYIQKVL